MQDIIETITRSTKFPLIYKQLQTFVDDEKRKRQEFYNTISENDKAEFINGKVIFHSPVKLMHNIAVSLLFNLLSNYVRKYSLGFVGIEKIMIALQRNDYEPDICYFRAEKANEFEQHKMLFPAPDFVVEVLSDGTKRIDRGIKFKDYAFNGIPEYWIIAPDKKIVEQYLLRNGEYLLLHKASEGKIKCRQVEGFEIEIEAIFDEQRNMKALSEILLETKK